MGLNQKKSKVIGCCQYPMLVTANSTAIKIGMVRKLAGGFVASALRGFAGAGRKSSSESSN